MNFEPIDPKTVVELYLAEHVPRECVTLPSPFLGFVVVLVEESDWYVDEYPIGFWIEPLPEFL